jgi:serine/threonine-protein kinase
MTTLDAAAAALTCATCGRMCTAGYRACPWCGAPIGGGEDATIEGIEVDFGWARATIVERLGEGGMGTVYRASMQPMGAGGVQPAFEAAVKVLRPTFAMPGKPRDMFANEARTLATLAHPNIVRFLGVAGVQGTCAIAMEIVVGETLQSLIDRKARDARTRRTSQPGVRVLPCLPFDRAWHYFQQLLGALAATHAVGVIHRDIKPDNVLLRVDGVAKLTDFGIARVPEPVAVSTGNLIAGTVAYMSPEQIQGHSLDGRSDLYSAAVALFEMLTGRLPFPTEGRSDWLVACDHVQTEPPKLRSLLPQAPIELEMLMRRALSKRADERFPDAIAFGDAFRTTLGMPASEGWRAQQQLAIEAARYAARVRSGTPVTHEAPALQSARDAVATAYSRR